MAKLTLTDLTAGYSSTALSASNNALIEAALENTVSRDGTAPNAMSAALDLNSNKINNVADGTSNQDAVTLAQLNAASVVATTAAASAVTVADAAANLDATTVEGALAEIYTDFVAADAVDMASLAAVTNGNGASLVGVEDSAGNFTAADVEAALTELYDSMHVSGSYTGTLTGLTTSPTITVYYAISGNICTLQCTAQSGTSNSTGLTITGGPAAIQPARLNQVGICEIQNNGTVQLGSVSIETSGDLTFHSGVAAAVFTASGTKGVYRMLVSYPLA